MKISFSGDICVNNCPREIKLDKFVTDIYASCDFNIACLEAPILYQDLPEYSKIGPNLRQSNERIYDILKWFSHVSLANNHSMDYGIEGLRETIDYLNSVNITEIGAGLEYPLMYKPAIIEKDDVRVAIFCWAEAQYGCSKSPEHKEGYAWMLNPLTYRLIQEYKKTCDYVILFLHAGLEDVEHPIIEWRNQYKAFIDFGADLIVGGHPHAIQGKETYNGKNIYYSLGNFFFNGENASDNEMWTNSLMLECFITKQGISISEHFLKFDENRIVASIPEVEKHFTSLSELLKQESFEMYKSIHDEMILNCWNEYYQSYYSYPIWKIKPPVIFYRRWFNILMKDYAHHCFLPAVSENKLYHNINIDTHRFVVSRVCSMLANTY